MSPSSRRAWIEMKLFVNILPLYGVVALLAEGVDRNFGFRNLLPSSMPSPSSRRAWIEIGCRPSWSCADDVALLAEGVDRNDLDLQVDACEKVALLAEGVDRNPKSSTTTTPTCVALLAEGVDRNLRSKLLARQKNRSPSSRRAWIEILIILYHTFGICVALLAEGVDRNLTALESGLSGGGRPPRGGRG